MLKLSVVVITLNEERNIGRCLASVREIADDIVIVDSNSTDKTEVICNTFGARFIQHPFEGYVQQKNYAVSQAKYDHVLSLDADEALSEELLLSIKKAKENFDADGYTMNRLTNYAGKWIRYSGWYPDVKLRLFDRRKGAWTGLLIHEKYELRKGNRLQHLEGDLLHYSYYTIEEHILQANKFSSIAANQLIEKHPRILFWHVFVNPTFKFIRNYFIKLGFLDGYYGLIICTITAYETFQKYAKAWHISRLQRKKKFDPVK